MGKTTTRRRPQTLGERPREMIGRRTSDASRRSERAGEREGDAQILNRVGIEMESGSKNNRPSTDGPMHGNGANPVKVEPRSKGGKRSASRYRGRQLSRLGGDDARGPRTARRVGSSPRRNIKYPLGGCLRIINYSLKRSTARVWMREYLLSAWLSCISRKGSFIGS